jgi:hypothetical protein
MKTIEERLAQAKAQLARQQAEWDAAKAALAKLGDAPLRVPVASLVAIDAAARRAQAAVGAIAA